MPELIKFPCSYQRPHTTPRDTREITYGMAIFSYDDIDRPHCQYQLHQYTKYGQLSNNIQVITLFYLVYLTFTSTRKAGGAEELLRDGAW